MLLLGPASVVDVGCGLGELGQKGGRLVDELEQGGVVLERDVGDVDALLLVLGDHLRERRRRASPLHQAGGLASAGGGVRRV